MIQIETKITDEYNSYRKETKDIIYENKNIIVIFKDERVEKEKNDYDWKWLSFFVMQKCKEYYNRNKTYEVIKPYYSFMKITSPKLQDIAIAFQQISWRFHKNTDYYDIKNYLYDWTFYYNRYKCLKYQYYHYFYEDELKEINNYKHKLKKSQIHKWNIEWFKSNSNNCSKWSIWENTNYWWSFLNYK